MDHELNVEGGPAHRTSSSKAKLMPKGKRLLVASLLLVAMPGAPSSVLPPSSKARSP